MLWILYKQLSENSYIQMIDVRIFGFLKRKPLKKYAMNSIKINEKFSEYISVQIKIHRAMFIPTVISGSES